MRVWMMSVAAVVVFTACQSTTVDISDVPELPPASPELIQEIVTTSPVPVVVNVWASWCIPCRSEAPLLRIAHEQLGDRVRFVGVDVQDNQNDARAFLAEFGLEFENYFDPRRSVPASLERGGVPITFFFANGRLESVHSGVIDERTLAQSIDDLLAATED